MRRKTKFKILIAIILVMVSIYFYPFISSCRVLPKNTDYNIVLDDSLYQLTVRGLVVKGQLYDRGWKFRYPRFFFNRARKEIYFDGCYDCGHWVNTDKHSIYKLDLNAYILDPIFVIKTYHWANLSSFSPDGNFLLFKSGEEGKIKGTLYFLDLNSKGKQELTDDYYSPYKAVWLNNHQFVYCGLNVNESNNKRPLFLYDIKTKTKKNLDLDGYYPGAVTPDGKELMLSGNGKTIFYNINDKTIRAFADKELRITNMVWLPDGKGFLYSDYKLIDILASFELPYGLYYYSLEKKRSVRLRKLYDLATKGGFVLPSDIKIKIPDTKQNRKILDPKYKDIHLLKLCGW